MIYEQFKAENAAAKLVVNLLGAALLYSSLYHFGGAWGLVLAAGIKLSLPEPKGR
jgi:hypothetical protein